MRALERPTRLKLSHNPTSLLIVSIQKKLRREKRKKAYRMS